MCTVLVLFRPGDAWPLLVGANRDESFDRAFLPPGRHWPSAPGIVAPRDLTAGGTWLGVNERGVFATIVNGIDRLGPAEGKTSRGELVLRALEEPDATRAVRAVGALDAQRYRGFTLLVADRETAHAVSSDERTIRVDVLAPGHHMVTPEGCDAAGSPRFEAHFPAFRAAPPPVPPRDWEDWIELLRHADDDDPHRAMTVVTDAGFGTVCSALLALPAAPQETPLLMFANGPPTRVPYEPVIAPWADVTNVGRA